MQLFEVLFLYFHENRAEFIIFFLTHLNSADLRGNTQRNHTPEDDHNGNGEI